MSCCTDESCLEFSYDSKRNFFTKEEKIEMLNEYHKNLLFEAKGVEERINDIKNSKNRTDED